MSELTALDNAGRSAADRPTEQSVTPFTVSDAGRYYGVTPRVISDLFYCRKLDDRRCPIIGGRRRIPLDYLPEVEAVLRRAGHLAAEPIRAEEAGK